MWFVCCVCCVWSLSLCLGRGVPCVVFCGSYIVCCVCRVRSVMGDVCTVISMLCGSYVLCAVCVI